jgi:hypothetical protein
LFVSPGNVTELVTEGTARSKPPAKEPPVKRFAVVVLFLSIVAVPSFAKTHKDEYSVSCTVLWATVKDTLRNSRKYEIIGIDNTR